MIPGCKDFLDDPEVEEWDVVISGHLHEAGVAGTSSPF